MYDSNINSFSLVLRNSFSLIIKNLYHKLILSSSHKLIPHMLLLVLTKSYRKLQKKLVLLHTTNVSYFLLNPKIHLFYSQTLTTNSILFLK